MEGEEGRLSGPLYPGGGRGTTRAQEAGKKRTGTEECKWSRLGLDMQRKKYLRRARRGVLRESQGKILLLYIPPHLPLPEKKRGRDQRRGRERNKVRRQSLESSAKERRPCIDASYIDTQCSAVDAAAAAAQPAFRRIENFISRLYRYEDVGRNSKACLIISYRSLFPCFMTLIDPIDEARKVDHGIRDYQ